MAGKHVDLVNFTKKYKSELHAFYLSMESWKKFKTIHTLNWEKVRFEKANQPKIPKTRGIYIFTLELSPTKLPNHGYIMYVGITGDISHATLYKRFSQYALQLKNENGRPAVFNMLKNWSPDLFFNYAELPVKTVSLHKIETAIINAVIPPINKTDMDADIKAAKAAAF